MSVAANSIRAGTSLRNQTVPIRDGVHLATDIYLPEGTGPWPVLMERTP